VLTTTKPEEVGGGASGAAAARPVSLHELDGIVRTAVRR
jgi:hypothetical protein